MNTISTGRRLEHRVALGRIPRGEIIVMIIVQGVMLAVGISTFVLGLVVLED